MCLLAVWLGGHCTQGAVVFFDLDRQKYVVEDIMEDITEPTSKTECVLCLVAPTYLTSFLGVLQSTYLTSFLGVPSTHLPYTFLGVSGLPPCCVFTPVHVSHRMRNQAIRACAHQSCSSTTLGCPAKDVRRGKHTP